MLIAIKYFQIQVHWQNIAGFVKKQTRLKLYSPYETVSLIAFYTFSSKQLNSTIELKTITNKKLLCQLFVI